VATSQLVCQWCTNPISGDATECPSCGAVLPRPELAVPELSETRVGTVEFENEAAEARAMLARLEQGGNSSPARRASRDTSDDLLLIAVILVGCAVLGGLAGWLLLPPILSDLFAAHLGIESDDLNDFRRMGAFIGTMGSLLFGALVSTAIRR
jgi:hypothetical protein